MTKTKADPKGSKKPVKKTAKTSTTLMNITKLGGGLKAESKGAGTKKSGSVEVEKRKEDTNRVIAMKEGKADRNENGTLTERGLGSSTGE